MRMREHVDGRIAHRGQIALCLILAQAESRVKRAEHEVEAVDERRIEIALPVRREVHLDRAQNAKSRGAVLLVEAASSGQLVRSTDSDARPLGFHAQNDAARPLLRTVRGGCE